MFETKSKGKGKKQDLAISVGAKGWMNSSSVELRLLSGHHVIGFEGLIDKGCI